MNSKLEGKVCGKCKIYKDIGEFAFKNKNKGTHSSECKPCHRKIRNEFYVNNEHEKTRLLESNKRRREEARNWMVSLKETLKCNRCGESKPATLQFHHKDPKEKDFNIATAIARSWIREKILEEMTKCEVLCANCHAQEHFGHLYADVS